MDLKYSNKELNRFFYFKNEIKELLTYPELQYSIKESNIELKITFPYTIRDNSKNGLVIVKFAAFINELSKHDTPYQIQKYKNETIFKFDILRLLNAKTFTMPNSKAVFFYSV